MGIFSKSPGGKKPYFGLTGGWLTVWITVACATDMSKRENDLSTMVLSMLISGSIVWL